MLIGFCGLPGAGKTTAALHLADAHGFEHINVGDTIKAMLIGFYGAITEMTFEEARRHVCGDLKEVPDPLLNGKTPRYAMQTLGYEWRNLISPTLFADRWGDRLDLAENAVADGMRYLDEIHVLKARGGTLVRIARLGVSDITGHFAELQELPADLEIVNDGSIIDLYDKVDLLIQ